MERAKTNAGSSSRRRDAQNRRRTVSGALPGIAGQRKQDTLTPLEIMRLPNTSPSAPNTPTTLTGQPPTSASPATPSSAHKRSFSNNILAKFSFLRNNQTASGRPPSREQRPVSREKEASSPTKSLFSRKSVDDDEVAVVDPETSPPKEERESALGVALKQAGKTRKRKGSLRKTALLGGRRNVTEGRERKGSFSLLQRSGSAAKAQEQNRTTILEKEDVQQPVRQYAEVPDVNDVYTHDYGHSSNKSLRRQFSYESAVASSSSESGWSEPAAVSQARLALLTEHTSTISREANGHHSTTNSTTTDLGSPLDPKSPTSQASYTSTTTGTSDDDQPLTLASISTKPPLPSASSPTTSPTSYFPPMSSPPAPHPSKPKKSRSTHRSPLSRSLPLTAGTTRDSLSSDPTPHDYTTTETWGWTLLAVTWLTFTIGMGSSLDLWSWAWDVGETPYAPPELEDDPTLPIVGYYPALIVLTVGVVSWVWVTVAWVGMKYFRHAKIEV